VKRRFSKIACIAAALCAFFTVLLTVIPLNAQQQAMISQRDKLIHAAVFTLLTTCVAWALTGFVQSRRRLLVLTAILMVVFASIDELVQWFVPTRTVDMEDWIADCLGITLGLIAYTLIAIVVSAIVVKKDGGMRQPVEK